MASQASARCLSCMIHTVTGGTATVANGDGAARLGSSPFQAGGVLGCSGTSCPSAAVSDVLFDGQPISKLHNVIFFQLFIRRMFRLVSDKPIKTVRTTQISLAPESQWRLWWNPKNSRAATSWAPTSNHKPQGPCSWKPEFRLPNPHCGWPSSHDSQTDELERWSVLHWLPGLAAMRGKEKCGAGFGRRREPSIGCHSLCTRPAKLIRTSNAPSFR